MALGTVWEPLALFMQFHRRLLKPAGVIGSNVHVEDPMPHRFARAVGATFLLTATAALLTGALTVGWTLTLIVTALAFINLTVQFCVGCFMYLQLDLIGLLPHSIASDRALDS
jgi:hypothetical protein